MIPSLSFVPGALWTIALGLIVVYSEAGHDVSLFPPRRDLLFLLP
jgi:hypothetical protein